MGPRLKLLSLSFTATLLLAGAGIYVLSRDRGPSNQGNPDARHFENQAREAGITFRMNFLPGEQGERFKINLYDHGCGVAVADFDGDGRDDIYFVNQLGPNALYRNKGDGTFEDVTAKAGVGLGDRVCVGATWADYDNDGRQDLYVTSTRGGNVLFHNNGDGTFKNVTAAAGVGHVGHSQTAVFFDYDRDGLLDLFVTNSARWTEQALARNGPYYPGLSTMWDLAVSPKEDNVFYRNNGDGTFTDVTAKAGLKGKGWSGDVAVFDYDEDGWLDLFVTNMFGRSQLYRNQGDGSFKDVTAQTLKRTSFGAIGVKVFDYNNDGRLDLMMVDMHSDMWIEYDDSPYSAPDYTPMLEQIRSVERKKIPLGTDPNFDNKTVPDEQKNRVKDLFQIRYDQVIFGNTLFKNLGGGRFEEVSDRANLETFWPWGVATGDFNNDGHEDAFIPSGMGYPYVYWPNHLMMNNGDSTFTDRAAAEGVEPPAGGPFLDEKVGTRLAARSSRCAATADFDGSGRLSIITNNFNDAPYYFRNHFPTNRYVSFRLRGTRSNRDAIGAVVRLYSGQEVFTRQVHPAGGYLSQSSKTVHFGLGGRKKIDRVEILWPSGRRQVIDAPQGNRLHDVVEPVEGIAQFRMKECLQASL